MTRTMYRDAYRLQGIYRGAVIEEGQPRVDRQLQAAERPGVRRTPRWRSTAPASDGRRVVLFAPTWRGDTFQDPQANAAQLVSAVRKLQSALGTDEHVVLLKVHQAVYRAVRERVGNADFLVSNEIPTNLVLAVTDLLVTDYSSVFFDFLVSGRPLVHFVPDLDEYVDGRGLYLGTGGPARPDVRHHPRARRAGAEGPREAVPVARTAAGRRGLLPQGRRRGDRARRRHRVPRRGRVGVHRAPGLRDRQADGCWSTSAA